MTRKVDGVQALEFRENGRRTQRCSRCHRKRQQRQLLLPTTGSDGLDLVPIMVGQDLCGMLCADCIHSVEMHIQAVFPDRHAFPFVDSRGELLPTPRCDQGHALIYAHDGSGMVCEQCDVLPREPFDVDGDARATLEDDPS